MEYQFTHTMHGVVAKCSMDHEAFGHWLNTEISPEPSKLPDILRKIEHCRQHPNEEWVMEGREYSLYLSAEEVMAKANNVELEPDNVDEMEEGFQFYDQESVAFCGLDDFKAFLEAYQRFIFTYH